MYTYMYVYIYKIIIHYMFVLFCNHTCTIHSIGFYKRERPNGAVNTVMQDCAASSNNIHKVLVLVNAH